MNHYRILFYKTNFFNTQHHDAPAEKANHFHIVKNNRKSGEQSKLQSAIKMILDDTGENKELRDLMERSHFLKKPDSIYECVGITFMEKHGVRIEVKLAANNKIIFRGKP